MIGSHVVGRIGRAHDHANGQVELARKHPVAFVGGGHSHDRARAVLAQHIVGDPDRQSLTVGRVDREAANRHARLFALGRHALDVRLTARAFDVRLDLGSALGRGQLLDQWVLGRQHDVGHAEDRIDARGEHRDLQFRIAACPAERSGALVHGQIELNAY